MECLRVRDDAPRRPPCRHCLQTSPDGAVVEAGASFDRLNWLAAKGAEHLADLAVGPDHDLEFFDQGDSLPAWKTTACAAAPCPGCWDPVAGSSPGFIQHSVRTPLERR